jgi:hypothetical protein
LKFSVRAEPFDKAQDKMRAKGAEFEAFQQPVCAPFIFRLSHAGTLDTNAL